MTKQSSFLEQSAAHAQTYAALSPEKVVELNLQCLDFHVETFQVSHSITSSKAFQEFRRLIQQAGASRLEVAVKAEDGELHAARFALLCDPPTPAMLHKVLAYLTSTCPSLDLSPIYLLTEGEFDWSKVVHLVCGIDLRERSEMSRVKVWIFANDQPGVPCNPVQKAISIQGQHPLFDALHVHTDTLLGYDFRFDGSSALRLYPDITAEELRVESIRERLSAALPQQALDVMEDAGWTHFQLSSRNTDTVLQLHLKDPSVFIKRWLRNPLAIKVHDVYRNAPLLHVVASAPVGELQEDTVRNFALYYQLAGSPVQS